MKISLSSENSSNSADEVRNFRKAPLVLFPPILGNSFCYSELLMHVTDRPVYSFDIKFEGSSGFSFSSLEELAKKMLDSLRKIYSNSPFFLLGWSFGGILAAEVCKQILVEDNPAPCYLVLIDTPTLSNLNAVDNVQFAENLRDIVSILSAHAKITEEIIIRSSLSKEGQVGASFSALETLIRQSSMLDLSMKNQLVGMLNCSRENMLLCLNSRENSDSIIFENPVLLISTKETCARYKCDKDLGWKSKVKSDTLVEVVQIPDEDHFSVISSPNVLLHIADTIKIWNKNFNIDKIQVITSLLSLMNHIEVKDQKSKKYLQKMFKQSFQPTLFNLLQGEDFSQEEQKKLYATSHPHQL